MKLTFAILGYVILAVAIVTVVRFFLERRRQKQVDATGTVVYATLVSVEPVKMFGKVQGDLNKVTLRLQEPGETAAREVSLRTRIDARSNMNPGARIPVVIDPKDPKRVYPASAESAKRAVLTGSRVERRAMDAQMRNPGRGTGAQMPSGYMPPGMNKRPKRF
ncbi:hypothetical protein ACFQBQ_13735 [Granulicella cerasi]|uniref:Uncharacterized protein n=1 Tax=Granulicella cerasi TaxID=741063 RepID=A0ABW1ZD76_9BACT|nr:hypothetical protein [Granulicella cerasi]